MLVVVQHCSFAHVMSGTEMLLGEMPTIDMSELPKDDALAITGVAGSLPNGKPVS